MGMMKKKEEAETLLLKEINDMLSYNMKEMQQCLVTAGKMFYGCDETASKRQKGREVVESTILKECVGCQEKKGCKFTMEDKDRLGQIMEQQGGLSLRNFKDCHFCKKSRDFVEEANRIYERELFLTSMEQEMWDTRKMIGKQYIEAGKMLGEFSLNQFQLSMEKEQIQKRVIQGFAKKHISVKGVYVHENEEKGKQMYLFLKKQKGKEITSRQAAALLSELIQRKMQPIPGQKKIIGNRYEMIGFTPIAKFHVLGGIISKPYEEGQKNGDSFSLGNIGERRYVSMISDGMGTGNDASTESSKVIEVLEELLESGMNEVHAIRLLQSVFIFWPEREKYSTLDYFQMDLFAGVGTFLKLGACPCFLKRKGEVEVLGKESLPVGVSNYKKLPFYRKKLESEDFILQVSDGVVDSIEGDGIGLIKKYMEEITALRPQAFIEELFQKIEKSNGYQKKDDVTMIGLGIWDKY